MLIRIIDDEETFEYHVNPRCIVGVYKDWGSYYVDLPGPEQHEIDRGSYKTILQWMEGEL